MTLNIFEKVIIAYFSICLSFVVMWIIGFALGSLGLFHPGVVSIIAICSYLVGWIWGTIWFYKKVGQRYLQYKVRREQRENPNPA